METFPSLLQQHATQGGNRTALRMKRHGIWNSYTWSDVANEVQKLACGFAATGLKPGDKVAIIGNNVPPLFFSILAAQSLGAIPVPMHADSTTAELKGLLENCEARFAVLQDQQQVDAIYEVIKELPMLTEVVYFDERGMREYDHTHLKSYIEFEELGEQFAKEHPSFIGDVSSKVTPDTEAFIVYTAGTSGVCRGAVLTHSNFLTTGQAFVDQEGIGENEEVYAYLPLSYASTLFFVYALWMIKGYTINCPESNETILADMREVGPTLFYGPPHFYKAVYSQIQSRTENTKSSLLQKHMSSLMTQGRTWLGDKLVFNQVKDLYGISRIKHAYVGGDVLSEEVFKFYLALGINLKATYGTAESAGCISVQDAQDTKADHAETMVGAPLPGVDVKVDNKEICFKGTNAFKGYYRDEAHNSSVVSADGWIKTGDIGDMVGTHIHVVERTDCVSKFSNGAEFLPKQIENALKSSTYIQDAVVIGEDREHMAALIVIDAETVGAWAERQQMQFTGLRDLATKDEVTDLISAKVSEVNSCMEHVGGANCPQIKRHTILHTELNPSAGEMTRSRKIRRNIVANNYKSLIDALYSGVDKYDVTDSNGDIVAQLRLQTA
ncbi:MAG: long-chain fatty acid--CoA ligase [Gammaproteobacteria bacterium]